MSEIALREESQAIAVIGDPEAEVEWASRCAKALVKAISGNPQLKVAISGRDYIKVEGWQTLGAMTKIDHVEVVWCREYAAPGGGKPIGWEARVEVRDRDGNVRGTGEAMCVRTEKSWANRDEFAIRSMAQTRAMGKAYRMALSYIVSLAGYQPTPAEEMPDVPASAFQAPATARKQRAESVQTEEENWAFAQEKEKLLALAGRLGKRQLTEEALANHEGDTGWVKRAIRAAEKQVAEAEKDINF
jgi:hypothetical protein